MNISALLAALLVLAACSKKDGGGDSASDPAATPLENVVSGQQVIPDPEAGPGTVNEPEDTTPPPPPPPHMDLRPDAIPTYALPTNFQDIDPRTFTPSGTFVTGGGIPALDFTKSNILVPSDGWMREHAACKYPIRAPGKDAVSVTVDGSVGEWPASSIVVVDRAGDGAMGASSRDLRSMRWAKDATYYYMAFETEANAVADTLIRLNFSKLRLPTDNTIDPNIYYVAGDRLLTTIAFNALYVYDESTYVAQTPGTGVGQLDYALATSGKIVELKIPRSIIDPLMDGEPFAVTVAAEFTGKSDKLGGHLVGLTDDYACLVPLPDPAGNLNTYKMVVMRRATGVSASDAEIVYRAMIAAMPEATLAAKDNYDLVDTTPLTVLVNMSSAGVCGPQIGTFMKHDLWDRFGKQHRPWMNFRVAAHEYLHNFNAQDYALPASWGVEGHSEWMTTKAHTSFYGKWAAQATFGSNVRSFRDEEAVNGVQSISQDAWRDAPYTGLFYYHKAEAYWDILGTKVAYQDLLDNFYRTAQLSAPYADSDAMIAGIKDLSSYSLLAGDDIESGWFGGSYGSVLPITLLDDTDGDGLFNYQEAIFGTNPANTDSDNDGLSDTFEWATGSNPLVSSPRNQLVFDQSLADWDRMASTKMSTAFTHNNVCSAQLKRFGLVQSQGWLFFAAELTAEVASTEWAILIFDVYEPGKPAVQMVVDSGTDYVSPQYIDGSQPGKFRPLDMGANRPGGKAFELAYNLAWMGWSSVPSGTYVKVRFLTMDKNTNAYTTCDSSGNAAIQDF